MMNFDFNCKWDNEGVDLYIDSGKGSEKVGRIPKGIPQAVLNVAAPRISDGKEIKLFKYILTPNFDKQSMNVRLFDEKMKIAEYVIEVDAKDAEIVKET